MPPQIASDGVNAGIVALGEAVFEASIKKKEEDLKRKMSELDQQ